MNCYVVVMNLSLPIVTVTSSVSLSEEEFESDGTDCEGRDKSHDVKACREGDQPKAGESEQEVCELMRSGEEQKSRLEMKFRNLGNKSIVGNSNIADDNNNAVSDTEVGTECGRNPNVVMLTNNSTSRKYDRKSYCCFCGVQQSKLVRHFRLKHQDEDDVRSLIGENDKAKKNLAVLKLRNLGDHEHNRTVVERGSGEFLVRYRPKADADYRSFVPCRYCYGYFSKKSIWKHLCPLAPKTDDGRKVKGLRKGGTSLLDKTGDKTVDTGFAGMMHGMRQDGLGKLASKDALILSFGKKLCIKFGGESEQFNYIRGRMRHAAKLLEHLRTLTKEALHSMSDFIQPTKFRIVLEAAQQCAGVSDGGGRYQTPSHALKSGGLVRRLAEIKQTQALERGDTVTAEECVQFLKLCDLNWSNDVSSVALRNLSDRKRTGVRYLPLTEDVVKLNQFLMSEANSSMEVSNIDDFMKLTQVALAKLILFNRKRQGEVSKITMEAFGKKGKADSSQEMMSALTEFERGLVKVLDRVEIKGKKGSTVPVLITEEVNAWLDTLLKHRSVFVPKNNEYLFAAAAEHSHFRGSDVLRQFAYKCGAKKPHLLTSTNLRKHIASTAQVLSLREHELDALATFLGHDIRIHTHFYRMPSDIIQIARISKLFLAAEKGKLVQFAGKELSDVTVGPDDEVSDDNEDETESQDSDSNEPDSTENPKKKTHGMMIKLTDEEKGHSEDKTVSHAKSSESESTERPEKKRRRMVIKKKWTDDDRNKVANYFASDILHKRLPGKAAIEKFLAESGIARKWTNVKDYLRNQYLHG